MITVNWSIVEGKFTILVRWIPPDDLCGVFSQLPSNPPVLQAQAVLS